MKERRWRRGRISGRQRGGRIGNGGGKGMGRKGGRRERGCKELMRIYASFIVSNIDYAWIIS